MRKSCRILEINENLITKYVQKLGHINKLINAAMTSS